jgi:hypothetical protein
VAVTFDDGYLDALTTARPMLERTIPTFFLTSDRLAVEHEFWWDTLERVLLGPGQLPASMLLPSAEGTRSIDTRTAEERRAAFWELYQVLQGQPADAREQRIGQVLAWSKAGAEPRRPQADRRRIRALVANPAFTIGTAPAYLPPGPRRRNAPTSLVQARPGGDRRPSVTAFAYPFGAWSARTARSSGRPASRSLSPAATSRCARWGILEAAEARR